MTTTIETVTFSHCCICGCIDPATGPIDMLCPNCGQDGLIIDTDDEEE